MSRDFFLLNRSFQLKKLCGSQQPPNFRIPLDKARAKLPAKLKEFYALLDRIVAAEQDSPEASAGESQLDDGQRRDLEHFERAVVANRFSSDEALKQPAVAMIRAIFADADYFSGLKPLPQYTDAFAYELLFPSWLNLLKATMLPKAVDGKPRLEGKRQGELFEFLGKLSALGSRDEFSLTGFLAFIASRFDAPDCEDLIQRAVDLYGKIGSSLVTALDRIDQESRDARELAQRLRDYLCVKYSLTSWTADSEYKIAYVRPRRRVIPESIAAQLTQSEAAEDWKVFFGLAAPLRLLIDSEEPLSSDIIDVLSSYPRQAGPLLSLLVQPDAKGNMRILAPEGQECLAQFISREVNLVSNHFTKLENFAKTIAARIVGFSEGSVQYFRRTLIEDESGRQLLLQACGSAVRRQELADQLLARAGKTQDDSRFLQLLICTALITPSEEAAEAKHALRALESVVSNRSIGTKELSDLVEDLQANYTLAMTYLASPLMAAAGKSPRLASLYLTLNEVSQRYAELGTVDNFSVLRAKFSKLTNMEFD